VHGKELFDSSKETSFKMLKPHTGKIHTGKIPEQGNASKSRSSMLDGTKDTSFKIMHFPFHDSALQTLCP